MDLVHVALPWIIAATASTLIIVVYGYVKANGLPKLPSLGSTDTTDLRLDLDTKLYYIRDKMQGKADAEVDQVLQMVAKIGAKGEGLTKPPGATP